MLKFYPNQVERQKKIKCVTVYRESPEIVYNLAHKHGLSAISIAHNDREQTINLRFTNKQKRKKEKKSLHSYTPNEHDMKQTQTNSTAKEAKRRVEKNRPHKELIRIFSFVWFNGSRIYSFLIILVKKWDHAVKIAIRWMVGWKQRTNIPTSSGLKSFVFSSVLYTTKYEADEFYIRLIITIDKYDKTLWYKLKHVRWLITQMIVDSYSRRSAHAQKCVL